MYEQELELFYNLLLSLVYHNVTFTTLRPIVLFVWWAPFSISSSLHPIIDNKYSNLNTYLVT